MRAVQTDIRQYDDGMSTTDRSTPFAGRGHDHARCVADALDAAAEVCQRIGARLTPLRQRVLELVWQSHKPVGAYDLLNALGRERDRVAPPTVYRALDFLVEHGLVHRIDSLNAFVGCAYPDANHRAYFLICDGCGSAAEIDDTQLGRALERSARDAGFTTRREVVEITGLCPGCRA